MLNFSKPNLVLDSDIHFPPYNTIFSDFTSLFGSSFNVEGRGVYAECVYPVLAKMFSQLRPYFIVSSFGILCLPDDTDKILSTKGTWYDVVDVIIDLCCNDRDLTSSLYHASNKEFYILGRNELTIFSILQTDIDWSFMEKVKSIPSPTFPGLNWYTNS